MQPRDKTIIRSAHLHRLQRRHFILFDVLPFFGTIVALALLPLHPIGPVEIGLFLSLWLLTGLGLTVGYHRLFTHRAFTTSAAMGAVFVILGSMAGRGPMLSWVAMHRRHHELSDRDGDLHSPNMHGSAFIGRLRGWWHAHIGWMVGHDYPNIAHYVPDLLGDHVLVAASRRYYTWVVIGLLVPAALGGLLTQTWWGAVTGFLWGGVVRMFVVEQSMSAINSCLHLFGARRFATRNDNSRNSRLFGVLVWGEGWHNNHHAFPYSASFGLRWHEIDLGFWSIRLLEFLGLVWKVKIPSREKIAARLASSREAEQSVPDVDPDIAALDASSPKRIA